MTRIEWFEGICKLIKKWGLGLVLFSFFLWQYLSINAERKEVQQTYVQTINSNVLILAKMEERLDELEGLNKECIRELNELRYEQRRLNDILGLPSKRYKNE